MPRMNYCSYSILALLTWVGVACSHSDAPQTTQVFSKLDSLTDTYLVLQDSMLLSWNLMANDETKKLNSLHEILLAMKNSNLFDQAQVVSLEQRLEQLKRIRFTQKSMANPYVVDEYDFASNALISEIIIAAEAFPEFVQQPNFQSHIDYVKLADQRVGQYREAYDLITSQFNEFLDKNKASLKDIDKDAPEGKRPLFQVPEN